MSIVNSENCVHCIELPKEATKLYQGDFLEGFVLENCEEFDDWQSLVRESNRLESSAAFADLNHYHEAVEDYSKAAKI